MTKQVQISKLNRRQFLTIAGIGAAAVIGAGFALRAYKHSKSNAMPTGPVALELTQELSLNLFVHIGVDNQVTLVAHRSEMGQGVRTSLPQILADELEADWEKIKIIQAPGDVRFGDQDTDGSHSVRSFYHTMRELGASARTMLCAAAAEMWQVPDDECFAKAHQVHHKNSDRHFTFGELAIAAAKQKTPAPESLKYKSKEEFNFIGKPMAMVDFEAMVRGTAQFGQDIQVPGMLHASIERSPVLGGKIKSFDASKAKAIAGVIDVIKIDGGKEPAIFNPHEGLAVVATNTWSAREARKLLQIDWDFSDSSNPHAKYNSTEAIESLLTASTIENKALAGKQKIRERGQVDQAFATSKKILKAAYSVPHLEHATMEPPAATVWPKDNHCEVWACVQNSQSAQEIVAGIFGLKSEQVVVHTTLLGGGFGRKSKPDFVAEAAVLAKKLNRPVKVVWTREDCFRFGYYHAFSVQHYQGALDEKNKLIALEADVASPSIGSLFTKNTDHMQSFELAQGFGNIPCDAPNLRLSNLAADAHTRIGWMRSVYNINHAFAYNSFIGEMARLAERDALQFYLESLGEDRIVDTNAEGFQQQLPDDAPFKIARLKNVLMKATESAHWPAPVSANEGWGLAAHKSFLSYTAVATKVALEKNNLRVLEAHIAIDCGQIVNPDRVRSQMEGAVIFGLSLALFGEISFKNGQAEQSRFDQYPLLRFHQCPKIFVTLVASDESHTGVGEPGVPPVAPSLVNAIVAAGGPRIRNLPISKHLSMA